MPTQNSKKNKEHSTSRHFRFTTIPCKQSHVGQVSASFLPALGPLAGPECLPSKSPPISV